MGDISMEKIIIIVALALVAWFVAKLLYPKASFYYVHHSNTDPTFVQQVTRILEQSEWKKFCRYEPTTNPEAAQIHIWLKPQAFMDERAGPAEYYHQDLNEYGQPLQPGQNQGRRIHFSTTYYADPSNVRVYINEANWAGCPESGLSLEDYRTYVINHEFGHALGYDHQPCNKETAPNGVCPVMYQSTRGPPVGFRCGYQPVAADLSARLY